MTRWLIRVDGEVQAVESVDDYDDYVLIGPVPDGVDPAHAAFDEAGTADPAPAWAAMRAERTRRLGESDWTALIDVPESTREAWQSYRQALRDLPGVTVDPLNPEWPERPGEA